MKIFRFFKNEPGASRDIPGFYGISRFMTGLEVEGGTGLYEVRRSDAESRDRLKRIEEELKACALALKVGETLQAHWQERIKALETPASSPASAAP